MIQDDINDIELEVNGKIILESREIITRELMWSKKIPFKKIAPLKWERIIWRDLSKPEDVNNKGIKKHIKSVGLSSESINEVIKGVKIQYPTIMDTIYKLIDPEEMRIIKKQCQELKLTKGGLTKNESTGLPKYQATRTYENGDKYVGDFVNGEFHGKGIYIYANGDKYEGEFANGKFTGKGIFTCSNGNQFTGNVENKVPVNFTIRCN